MRACRVPVLGVLALVTPVNWLPGTAGARMSMTVCSHSYRILKPLPYPPATVQGPSQSCPHKNPEKQVAEETNSEIMIIDYPSHTASK